MSPEQERDFLLILMPQAFTRSEAERVARVMGLKAENVR